MNATSPIALIYINGSENNNYLTALEKLLFGPPVKQPSEQGGFSGTHTAKTLEDVSQGGAAGIGILTTIRSGARVGM
jgi:hypothetical protein